VIGVGVLTQAASLGTAIRVFGYVMIATCLAGLTRAAHRTPPVGGGLPSRQSAERLAQAGFGLIPEPGQGGPEERGEIPGGSLEDELRGVGHLGPGPGRFLDDTVPGTPVTRPASLPPAASPRSAGAESGRPW